ncbi:hypothetical protein EIKCOROL_02481 [Eikenella corrodens ATCC 23834]|uniref:Uncharacterized protein n=1 Tax=Eikenella corrodens ATCC 23834 TaxID=546274 RepID=C0DYL5_EIKCO|nr:hypothetical protein EIKCOROL_02481 [Eikenella corrodens ATCC 23834]
MQAYFDQVVVFAGHEVAFEDLRDFQHFAAEFFKNIAGFRMQFDFHEHQQAVAQAGGVEAGMVAADVTVALQSAHTFGYGGGGKADAFGQLGHAQAGIFLQELEDVEVDAVGFFEGGAVGHGLLLSLSWLK